MEDVRILENLFESQRNPDNAEPMKKYMKDLFPFLGIKTPDRKQLMRSFYEKSKILKSPLQIDFIQTLWEKNEREYQYAAMDYIERSIKKLTKDELPLIKWMLTTKSWWDSVDRIATKFVGHIALQNPEVIPETIEAWASSENLWLRRTAILFQLKYKDKTDEELLYRFIRMNAESKEFFIQKAIGWALREYSKTNPDSVRTFIGENQLAKLSIREGSKYL